jgi:hypothetical protein
LLKEQDASCGRGRLGRRAAVARADDEQAGETNNEAKPKPHLSSSVASECRLRDGDYMLQRLLEGRGVVKFLLNRLN